MQKKTRSLLEELNDFAIKKDKESVLESRAIHIIDSAINLLRLIKENYKEEDAYELERRLINSIRAQDPAKFARGVKRLKNED